MGLSGMRPRIHSMPFPSEIGEFAAEVRQIFVELGRTFGSESQAGECATVDLAGVDPAAVRVVGKGDSVLIAGEKAARRARRESSFHLVERGYGRFARAVRLGRPCDMSRARATLTNGELRISIPKIAEQRGRPIAITVNG